MSISNNTIKSIAKGILAGNYISSFIVSLVLLSVMFASYNIAAVLSYVFGGFVWIVFLLLIYFFLIAPLCVGVLRYFWRLSCGVKDNPISIFNYFSSKKLYTKTLHLLLLLVVRIGVTLLIFSVPILIAKLISSNWLYSVLDMPIPIWTVNLTNVIRFLSFLAISLTTFSALKYYLAPMLFVADNDIDVYEVLHLSVVISKKTILDYLFLIFNFAGWILLSVLVIPLIYTIPYMVVVYLVHSSYAVNDFNEKIAKISLDDIPTYVAGV